MTYSERERECTFAVFAKTIIKKAKHCISHVVLFHTLVNKSLMHHCATTDINLYT